MEENSFSSCVGNIVITIILVFVVFKVFDYFQKLDEVSANEITKPTIADIKNDLLGNKVDRWHFDELREFSEFNIIHYEIINEYTMEIEVDLKLKDFNSNNKYKGSIIVTYTRNNKEVKYWTFSDLNGNIYPDNSDERKSEHFQNNNESEDVGTVFKDAAREAVIEAVIETVTNGNKRKDVICDWCGEDVKSKIYYVNSPYDDCEVSSVSGVGSFHQDCAYKYCNNHRN